MCDGLICMLWGAMGRSESNLNASIKQCSKGQLIGGSIEAVCLNPPWALAKFPLNAVSTKQYLNCKCTSS